MPSYCCAECRYNLTGLPVPGRCPECGTEYDEHSRTWSARRPWRGVVPFLLTLGFIAIIVLKDGTDPEEMRNLILFIMVVSIGAGLMYRKYLAAEAVALAISADEIIVRQALQESRLSWDNIASVEPGRFRSIKIEQYLGDPVWIQWTFASVSERDECVAMMRSKLAEQLGEEEEEDKA